jgi:glutamine synthetase type III
MKNLKIEEIAKLQHCECESPCEACLEKYAHVFENDEEKIASISATNITGDAIANYVLTHTNAIYDYGTQFIQPKTDVDIINELIEDVKKIKQELAIILMNLK